MREMYKRKTMKRGYTVEEKGNEMLVKSQQKRGPQCSVSVLKHRNVSSTRFYTCVVHRLGSFKAGSLPVSYAIVLCWRFKETHTLQFRRFWRIVVRDLLKARLNGAGPVPG